MLHAARTCLLGVLTFCATLPCAFAANAQEIPVSTVPAERQPITKSFQFVGRLEAPERVDIRARVTGFLEGVLFKEGDTIQAGAPLYRIEKDTLEASVKEAQAGLERANADLALASIQRQRAETLLAQKVGTVVARDQAVAHEGIAKASKTSAEANLQTAQINLGYAVIAAPISGRIGRTALTKGNLVGPDSGILATMVSEDPMHVTFPVSQRELMAAREANQTDAKVLQLRIRFQDGALYDQIGTLNFVDVTVDRLTDTVTVRADIPNPKHTLTDGQLVRVELQTGTPTERVVVPQAALIADQGGVYVFVVEDGKAVVKRLKTEGESGPNVVVASGLSGGELVVVDGFQSLRPGMAVRATPAPTLKSGQ